MGWRRPKTPPLPPMPNPAVVAVERETEETRSFLKRLRVTIDFALDERDFHESGPKDIDALMKERNAGGPGNPRTC